MQPCKNIQVYAWAALTNIPCHGPADFAALKNPFVLVLCRLWITFKWTAVRAPPNTVQLISRCWRLFFSELYEAFQKHSSLRLGRVIPNTAQMFSRCWRTVSSGCYAAIWKHSSLWLGRAHQHLPSPPSSFCGVEESFRFDVMQTCNNVQMNGWSCSPKHSPARFTKSKKFFVWMAWNFSRTYNFKTGPCFFKRGPVPFAALKNLFVWMLCKHLKT